MNPKRFTVVCGVSGSGKTSFVIRYLLNERGLTTRFLFDPDGELSDRLKLPPVTSAAELDRAALSGWVCFDPSQMFAGRPADALRFFCAWSLAVSARLGGRSVLVVDEVWRYCSPNSVPPELANVLQTGRKVGLEGMFLTQRPNRLNGTVMNEATEIIAFRLREPAGLAVLEANGLDAEAVARLEDGAFWSVGNGAPFCGRIELPTSPR